MNKLISDKTTQALATANVNYLQVDGTPKYQVGDFPLDDYWNTYYQVIWPYYYPTIPIQQDKMATAFEIAKALMDKKAVAPKTIKDFTDLVDTIFKVL